MVKGTQKQMIVVRTNDSRLFEEAYFVLRDGYTGNDAALTMVEEANRILDESQLMPQKKKKRWSSKQIYLWGVVTGCTFCIFLVLLLIVCF